MPKRPRRLDICVESGKRRKVDQALKVQCPFRVYARERSHDYPEDHCKEGQTFRGNEKLNEHLDRYHSLRYWCPSCKTRFRFNSQDDLAVLKMEHKKRCTERPEREHKEWARYVVMSSEQESRWSDKKWKKVAIPRLEGETIPRYSWRQIYKCLFPETVEFPNPCYPPGIEPTSPQSAPLLPSQRDNSDMDLLPADIYPEAQPMYTLDPIPSSEVRQRLGAQGHGDDMGHAVRFLLDQPPRNTSLSPEELFHGQLQGQQRTRKESGATIATLRSGSADQVQPRDSPPQRPLSPYKGPPGLASFSMRSPAHSPATSRRILPELHPLSELPVPSECGSTESGAPLSDSGYGISPKASDADPYLYDADVDRGRRMQSIRGFLSDFDIRQDLGQGSWSEHSVTPSQGWTARIMPLNCHDLFENWDYWSNPKRLLGDTRPFSCDVAGCYYISDTSNDLERHHKKARHAAMEGYYRCDIGDCKVKNEIWARSDSFRLHQRMMHNRPFDAKCSGFCCVRFHARPPR